MRFGGKQGYSEKWRIAYRRGRKGRLSQQLKDNIKKILLSVKANGIMPKIKEGNEDEWISCISQPEGTFKGYSRTL
jgi:hypothetical protein